MPVWPSNASCVRMRDVGIDKMLGSTTGHLRLMRRLLPQPAPGLPARGPSPRVLGRCSRCFDDPFAVASLREAGA
jgi:hypothetical protein